jgi:hypothetical protein
MMWKIVMTILVFWLLFFAYTISAKVSRLVCFDYWDRLGNSTYVPLFEGFAFNCEPYLRFYNPIYCGG